MVKVPRTTMDFCGSRLDEATEESIDDHISAFSDLSESSDKAEPGRSKGSIPAMISVFETLLLVLLSCRFRSQTRSNERGLDSGY